jgi:hypothetical protein
MRIVERSATRLSLQGGSAWVSIVCFLAAALVGIASLMGRGHGGLVGAGLFLLCGIMLLRTSRVELDEQARILTLEKLRIFKRSSLAIPFDDISDVEVETDPLRTSKVPQSRLALVTAKGRIPLTDGYSAGSDNLAALRLAMLEALGRIGSDALDRELRELIGSHRTIAAVTLLRSRQALDLRTARMRVEELQRELDAARASG